MSHASSHLLPPSSEPASPSGRSEERTSFTAWERWHGCKDQSVSPVQGCSACERRGKTAAAADEESRSGEEPEAEDGDEGAGSGMEVDPSESEDVLREERGRRRTGLEIKSGSERGRNVSAGGSGHG